MSPVSALFQEEFWPPPPPLHGTGQSYKRTASGPVRPEKPSPACEAFRTFQVPLMSDAYLRQRRQGWLRPFLFLPLWPRMPFPLIWPSRPPPRSRPPSTLPLCPCSQGLQSDRPSLL